MCVNCLANQKRQQIRILFFGLENTSVLKTTAFSSHGQNKALTFKTQFLIGEKGTKKRSFCGWILNIFTVLSEYVKGNISLMSITVEREQTEH